MKWNKIWKDKYKYKFCNEIKYVFLKSLTHAKKGQLKVSRRQTVIKLTEKNIEIKGTLKIGDQYHYLTLIWKLYQKFSQKS